MKIEFVKEEKINGDVYWYTTTDGRYVEKSLSHKEDEAYNLYNKVKDFGGLSMTTVIESFDTETQTTN